MSNRNYLKCILCVSTDVFFGTLVLKVWRDFIQNGDGIRRLLNLQYATYSRFLHLICKDFPVNIQLLKRFNKFQ